MKEDIWMANKHYEKDTQHDYLWEKTTIYYTNTIYYKNHRAIPLTTYLLEWLN